MEQLKIATVSLHELTKTHPVMTTEQFTALKNDIAANGQKVPVLLYRGKIVDGRHRYKALTQLGRDTILANSLPNNMTLQEVKSEVESTELRRHQTPTQLAIKAYRMYESGILQAEALAKTGASKGNLSYVTQLIKMGRLDIVSLLEAGGKFDIGEANYPKPSDSLLGIVTFLKKQQAVLAMAVGTESGKERFTKEEQVMFDAVIAMIKVVPEKMLNPILANIYERKSNA